MLRISVASILTGVSFVFLLALFGYVRFVWRFKGAAFDTSVFHYPLYLAYAFVAFAIGLYVGSRIFHA
jgi:hypothetical protein